MLFGPLVDPPARDTSLLVKQQKTYISGPYYEGHIESHKNCGIMNKCQAIL
jgi:hypothetical protein